MMKVTPLLLAATALFTVALAAAAPDRFVVTEHAHAQPARTGGPVIQINDVALASIEKSQPVMSSVPFRVQWWIFTAPKRCPPCVALAGNIETRLVPTGFTVGEGERVHFRKIDVDENVELTARFNVKSVPTMVLMVDGVEVDRKAGYDGTFPAVDALAEMWNTQATTHPIVVPRQSFQAISIAEISGQENISKLFDMITSRGDKTVIKLNDKTELLLPQKMPMALATTSTEMGLTFTQERPRLKYAVGVLSVGQEVSGLTVERDRYVLKLPGFPDLQVTLRP